MKKTHWIVFVSSLLSACAMSPRVQFEGQSLANQELKSDTLESVSIYTQAQGCKSISHVHTMIITMPQGEFLATQHNEHWVAHGCNKQFPYTIGYRGDGVGGTYISVKKAE